MWQWVDEKERSKERKKDETKTGKPRQRATAAGSQCKGQGERGKGSCCYYFHNNFLIRKLQVQFSWKTPKRAGQSKQAKRKQIKDNFPKCISNELQPKVARPQLLQLLLLVWVGGAAACTASERANKLMTTSGKRRKEPSQAKSRLSWARPSRVLWLLPALALRPPIASLALFPLPPAPVATLARLHDQLKAAATSEPEPTAADSSSSFSRKHSRALRVNNSLRFSYFSRSPSLSLSNSLSLFLSLLLPRYPLQG